MEPQHRRVPSAAAVPSEPVSASDRSRILAAARKFYIEDKSKIEIADELQISRFKVARLLELGKSLGLVTITLNDQGAIDDDLSTRLAEHLGLTEALVVEAHGSDDDIRHQVGQTAAELLSTTLSPGDVLGMTWGRTLSALTEVLPSLPRLTVVQLTGAAGVNLYNSPVELVRQIALNSGGSAHPIFAPLVVGDEGVAEALRRQPDIERAIAQFRNVTTAVVAIGSWDPPESQLLETIRPEERQSLLDRGVVGEVGATLLSAEGAEVAGDFERRCVAISSAELRALPRVLAVAAGTRKAVATVAAARAGLITGIVADRALAHEVITGSDAVRVDRLDPSA
jgi:DNA-binding transcriptional regulator LsrR (DeoR family)